MMKITKNAVGLTILCLFFVLFVFFTVLEGNQVKTNVEYDSTAPWPSLQKSITEADYIQYMKKEEKLRASYLEHSTGEKGDKSIDNLKELVGDCEAYGRRASINNNIKCTEGLLARSGAEYLRSFLPPTDDVPGYAKLRILDSFALTNGKGACNFTEMKDGRHFKPLDFLKLRVIAEGVIAALGTEEGDHSHGTSHIDHNHTLSVSPSVAKRYLTERPSPGSASKPQHQFLVSEERARELADTRLVGHNLHSLLRKAFKDRHVAFAGDSTIGCLRHHLVAFLIAMTSDQPMDKVAREKLLNNQGVRSEEVFNTLLNDCPVVEERDKPPYFGGRCAYVATTTCNPDFGCSQTVALDDIAVSISEAVHHKNKGALGALDATFTLNELKKMEAQQIAERKEKKKASEKSSDLKTINFKKRKTVFIVHGAFHYLHLFPARGFYDLTALNLGHYQENMVLLLDMLRKYLGPESLVIWATAGTVCDEKLEGMYEKVLANLKEGTRRYPSFA